MKKNKQVTLDEMYDKKRKEEEKEEEEADDNDKDNKTKRHKKQTLQILKPNVFKQRLETILREETSVGMKNLIYQKNGVWSMDDAFVDALHNDMNLLINKHVERAALFGEYRATSNGPKKMKPSLAEIKESDFSLAWKSLEADAVGE